VTDCNYWLQYLPDGGIQWLLVKLWTSSIGQCVQWYQCIAMAIKMASKAGVFFVIVLIAGALAAAGMIRSE
jgi:hypothetical protein